MRCLWLVVLAALGCAVVVVAPACTSPAASGDVVHYSASSLDGGRPVSVGNLRGHPVLLTSWATWCLECRDELPALERVWRERRANGLKVVAVNVDLTGGPGRALAMAHRYGLTMPLWRDTGDTFTATFAGVGVPMSVLLGADGRLAKVWFGAIDFTDADVAGAIEAALETTPASS